MINQLMEQVAIEQVKLKMKANGYEEAFLNHDFFIANIRMQLKTKSVNEIVADYGIAE